MGIETTHYEEAVGLDILSSPPRSLLDYGALDTYMTLALFRLLLPIFLQRYPLWFRMIPLAKTALYFMEEQHQYFNLDKALEMREVVTMELEALKEEFYSKYGYVNLGSNLEKSRLLFRLGYYTGEDNKPRPDGERIMKTSAPLLEKLASSGCEVADYMVRFSKLSKFLGTYMEPIILHASEREDGSKLPVRFHFFDCRVPTGRYASGKYTIGRKPYPYFLPMNLQSISKPHSSLYGLDFDPKTCSCTFYDDPLKGEYCVETGDAAKNIRSIFAAPPGYVVVRADYCIPLDTLVATVDGDVPVGTLLGQEVMVKTPVGDRRAYNIHATGMKTCLEIQLESGRVLRCSEDHLVCVRTRSGYKWVKAEDLTEGDDVVEIQESQAYLVNGRFLRSPSSYLKGCLTPESVETLWLNFPRSYLSTLWGIPYPSVTHIIRSFLDFSSCSLRLAQRYVRDNTKYCFMDVESASKYYALGLLYGDGSLYEKTKIVNFSSNDYSLVNWMSAMFNTRKIRSVRKWSCHPTYMVDTSSLKLYLKLFDFGLRPRKSFTGCALGSIPSEFLHSFLLGLFDSDGFLAYCNNKTSLRLGWCGHISYMSTVYDLLLSLGYRAKMSRRADGLVLISLYADSVSFLCSAYKQAPFFCERKHSRFQAFISKDFSKDRYSKYV